MEVDSQGDGYSDDDLDALPSDTFLQLQQDAIRSTQQPEGENQHKLPTLTRSPHAARENVEAGFILVSPSNARHTYQHHGHPKVETPSSDYGDFDDELLDGEIFDAGEQPTVVPARDGNFMAEPIGELTQREQWRQQRYAAPSAVKHPARQRIPPKTPTFGGPGNSRTVDTCNLNNGLQKMDLSQGERTAARSNQSSENLEALKVQLREVRILYHTAMPQDS